MASEEESQPSSAPPAGITVEEWRRFVDNMHWMTLCTCCATAMSLMAIVWLNRKVTRMEAMYEEIYVPLSSPERRLPDSIATGPAWKNLTDQIQAVQYAVWGEDMHGIHNKIAEKHNMQGQQ